MSNTFPKVLPKVPGPGSNVSFGSSSVKLNPRKAAGQDETYVVPKISIGQSPKISIGQSPVNPRSSSNGSGARVVCPSAIQLKRDNFLAALGSTDVTDVSQINAPNGTLMRVLNECKSPELGRFFTAYAAFLQEPTLGTATAVNGRIGDPNQHCSVFSQGDETKKSEPVPVNISDDLYRPFQIAFAKVSVAKSTELLNGTELQELTKAMGNIAKELNNLMYYAVLNFMQRQGQQIEVIFQESPLPLPEIAASGLNLAPVPQEPPFNSALPDDLPPPRPRAAHTGPGEGSGNGT